MSKKQQAMEGEIREENLESDILQYCEHLESLGYTGQEISKGFILSSIYYSLEVGPKTVCEDLIKEIEACLTNVKAALKEL